MDNNNHRADVTSQLTQVIDFFTRILDSVSNQEELYAEIKQLVKCIYQVKNWSILRLDDTTNQLFFTILESDSETLLKQIPIQLGKGIAGEVASTGLPKIVCQVTPEANSFTKSVDAITGFETLSIIAVPIMYKNKILGVFELINVSDPQSFQTDPNQLLLMQTLANFIGIIFLFSNNHQEIIFSSERDALTGAYNRAFLKKVLDNYKSTHHMRNEDKTNEMLLVMIDLNNFKTVNDTLGHLAGDHVLKETANLLKSHFRQEDVLIRYGGDEFILLIHPCYYNDDNLISSIKEKLDTISKSIPHDCTIAFGISLGEKSKFEQLLQQADILMYKDKGRKKEVIYP